MCLAIPGKLIQVERDSAGVRMGKANFGGITKEVCLEYTPEADLGDYVLVHVGFAISKVDQAEAARTFQALKDLEQLGELETPEFDPMYFNDTPTTGPPNSSRKEQHEAPK
jgi:hydrogenase expression/formation protein HypC